MALIQTSLIFQLLSKMAPLIGKDLTESLFLDRFAGLCVDPLFRVRKVCASNFGDFATVVGGDATEKSLVINSNRRRFLRQKFITPYIIPASKILLPLRGWRVGSA